MTLPDPPPAEPAPFRCFGTGDPLYEAYHDTEWGRPVHGDRELYERLSLEAFQSGLSWITVLRRRETFRTAFAGFDPEAVAGFDDEDVARLMADPGIIRNRLKVEAVIANARAVVALRASGGLSELVWSHAPAPRPAPLTPDDVPGSTPESAALAKALKAAGLRFVGPTTAYATMQACGLVDDHLAHCPARR
ncbi:DNA-3-methyladenine glycosylase I [Kineococcus rubinsiae]|uniref:DNA-3-methyladenine glycosylase I n=1 Tax=Kineococcus rubinsiae TaxID=2609562 RepID=UPI0027E4D4DD|nr:DNA-3-methyladenine glycosylase I [Kineococcus rubinsiae]